VQILRHLGLAARFVSGYLIQLKPDLKALDGPPARRRIHRSATPGPRSISGRGWIVSIRLGPIDRRGPSAVAATPHYRAAAPISGAVEAAQSRLFLFMKRHARRREATRDFPFSEEA